MSDSTTRVELLFTAKDGTASGVKSVETAATQSHKRITAAADRESKRAADLVETSSSRQRSSFERLSRAREVLGIRSENAIQREISQTEAAYKRLEGSGRLSQEALARAAEKTREKITRLTNEMGKLTEAQKKAAQEAANLDKVQRGMRYGVAGAAGAAAAAYTLKSPAQQAMAFDEKLADLSNTAFAGKSLSARTFGMKQIEAAVNKSVGKGGGGTREQAAEAFNAMVASGVVTPEEAMNMLPTVMRHSSGSMSDAVELSTIGIRAQKTLGIPTKEFGNLMNMGVAGGQAGGFELKNMARWLPEQMSGASLLGLRGKDAFAKLVAWNQASIITSGTPDAAGNNMKDLLNYINTSHMKGFLASQLYGDGGRLGGGQREKSIKKVDQLYLDYQSRGIDKVTATIEIMSKIFSKNKEYAALQEKLKGAGTGEEKRAIYEAMSAQMQGTEIGKIFHNQQSLSAFAALMNQQDYVKEVLGTVKANDVSIGGAGDRNYELMSTTASFQMRQAGENKAIGEKAVMDSLTPSIGRAAAAFSDLAVKHPLLTGAVTLATSAVTAFAAAAGMSAMVLGGGNPGAVTRVAARHLPKAARVAKAAGIGGLAAFVGGAALDAGFGEDSAVSRYGSAALNWGATGAAFGSAIPVIGTAVGGGIGALGGMLYEYFKSQPQQPKMAATVDVRVTSDGRAVIQDSRINATNMNASMNSSTGNIYHGAPG